MLMRGNPNLFHRYQSKAWINLFRRYAAAAFRGMAFSPTAVFPAKTYRESSIKTTSSVTLPRARASHLPSGE